MSSVRARVTWWMVRARTGPLQNGAGLARRFRAACIVLGLVPPTWRALGAAVRGAGSAKPVVVVDGPADFSGKWFAPVTSGDKWKTLEVCGAFYFLEPLQWLVRHFL